MAGLMSPKRSHFFEVEDIMLVPFHYLDWSELSLGSRARVDMLKGWEVGDEGGVRWLHRYHTASM